MIRAPDNVNISIIVSNDGLVQETIFTGSINYIHLLGFALAAATSLASQLDKTAVQGGTFCSTQRHRSVHNQRSIQHHRAASTRQFNFNATELDHSGPLEQAGWSSVRYIVGLK